MSNAIDANGTTFTFNGVEVGGITQYTIFDGSTPDVQHNPLSASGRQYFPGAPEFGQFRFTLYRNPDDPGQAEMEQARANSVRAECVWTLVDGSTRTFPGYVKALPIAGNINGLGTAQCVIKVAGPVT